MDGAELASGRLLAEVGVGVASPHREGLVVRRVVIGREEHEARERPDRAPRAASF